MIRSLLCYFGFHKWRLGTLNEFPRGFVGCQCGALKRFNYKDYL